jgi:hypothetical protein
MYTTPFFYAHTGERDEQNILKSELALFRLKHNISANK